MSPSLFDGDYDRATVCLEKLRQRSRLDLTPYSEIPRKRVAWLWKNYIPFGKVVLVEGDPDVGKSTFLVDQVARVTRGANMPDGSPGCEPADALILSAEDDAEDTIGPRLLAAGADPARVHRASFTLDGAEREPTICSEDVALIEEKVRELGIVLVIIDPMTAYLDGDVRVYVDHDVRRALLPLKGLAERTGIALLVVRHWNKAANANALHRGGGSIGITAAARAVLAIAFDPDDGNPDQNERKRVLAVAKMNVGGRGPAREFQLHYDSECGACRVRWGGESEHTANSLSAPAGEDRSKLGDAVELLQDVLGRGEVLVQELEEMAKEQGISWATMIRAKKKARVKSRTGPDGPPWYWYLPQGDQAGDQGAHISVNDHLPMNGSGPDDHLRGDAWEGEVEP